MGTLILVFCLMKEENIQEGLLWWWSYMVFMLKATNFHKSSGNVPGKEQERLTFRHYHSVCFPLGAMKTKLEFLFDVLQAQPKFSVGQLSCSKLGWFSPHNFWCWKCISLCINHILHLCLDLSFILYLVGYRGTCWGCLGLVWLRTCFKAAEISKKYNQNSSRRTCINTCIVNAFSTIRVS